MDRLLEFLIPVVIFVIWIAGQLLERKKQQGAEDDPEHENEAQARRRKIREEIQRKIAENTGRQITPPPTARTDNPPPPRIPMPSKSSPYSTPPIMRGDGLPPQEDDFPPPTSTSTEPTFFEVPGPARNYEAELEEQRRRMEESKRKAEAARQRARQQTQSMERDVKRRPTRPTRVTGSLREDVIAVLADPRAARKAVLFQEILGTPVGLRKQGTMRPSWEN